MEIARKFEGQISACTCGKQPSHVRIRGKEMHYMECSPCRSRTQRFSTVQEAVAAWEAQQTTPFAQRGAA